MQWPKERLENFFEAKSTRVGRMHELRFEAGGIRYRLWLDERRDWLFLTGDVRDPDRSFPAIEVGCECRRIEETKASAVGPVLLFYASSDKAQEYLRLCITRDHEHRFSISPHWQQHENGGYGASRAR